MGQGCFTSNTETTDDHGKLRKGRRLWTRVLGGFVVPAYNRFLPSPFTLLGTLLYLDPGLPVEVGPAESQVPSLESVSLPRWGLVTRHTCPSSLA